MTATFVLVHGSNANASCWAQLQGELASLGQHSRAVDLPGHGPDAAPDTAQPSALAGIGPADNIEYVVEVVRQAAENGPVILVGHSRGGCTVDGVGAAIPDLLARIVYISAWCCVRPLDSYLRTPEYATNSIDAAAAALRIGSPHELGAVRLNWRGADANTLDLLQVALLADGSRAELHAFLHTLQSDETLVASAGPVDAAVWGRIPRAYIRLTADRSIPLELQDLFIRDADELTPDNVFDVHSVDSSHIGFLIRPQETAAILGGLA